MAQYDWTNETLEQEELLHRVYRKDINKYDKDIKSEIEEHRTRSWNKGLEKLADLGMDNAPQKFWTKILTMAGLKTRNNMTGELKDKQGKVATTDEEAAEIHADYAESAFKPLEEAEFDQENIAAI